MTPLSPFSRPVYVMAKPIGSACNLACKYCYYNPKNKATHGLLKMNDTVLEAYIEQYISAQMGDSVLFTWHGGEPMLRGLDFYKKVVKLQKKHAGNRYVDNSIQTNGTLLTPEWCQFLHDQHWLVGISIDGTQEMHDTYRLTHDGSSSWKRVIESIQLLNKHKVEWNAMATVNRITAEKPLEFYHFFKEIGCEYLQFTPVVERFKGEGLLANVEETGEVTDFSVTPQSWGNFLCTIFDEWVRNDVGKIFVQTFDATLAGWMGVQPGVCSMAETCGHAAVIEADGNVYSCDHFVFPEYLLGNILQTPLATLLYTPRQQYFGMQKQSTLTQQCKNCEWLFACHGECPRNRFALSQDGEKGHNYLCEGYQRYFSHVAPAMDFMKNELMNDRAPANVMKWIHEIRG